MQFGKKRVRRRRLRRVMNLGEVAIDLGANRFLTSGIISCELQQSAGDLLDRRPTSLRGDPQHIDYSQVLLDATPELGDDAELRHRSRDPRRMDFDEFRGFLVGRERANGVGSC